LEQAEQRATNLHTAIMQLPQPHLPRPIDPSARLQAFVHALAQDLDTPAALRILSGLATETSDAARVGRDVQAAQAALRRMCRIFGVRLGAQGAEAGVVSGWNHLLKQTLP